MPVFYLVHLNYDYEESMKPFSSPSQALRYIRDTFEVDAPITDPAFARAVDDSYASGDWRGLTIHAIGGETGRLIHLDLGRLAAAARSNHALMAFEADMRSKLGPQPAAA